MHGTQTQMWLGMLTRKQPIHVVTDMAILKLDIIIDKIKEIDNAEILDR